jgi:hypothetical protein
VGTRASGRRDARTDEPRSLADAAAPLTVEHPFGTIKAWMGATHFKMRRLTHVGTEMALHVLAYNIKRMIALIAVRGLLAAVKV